MNIYSQIAIGSVDASFAQAAYQANQDLINGLAEGNAAKVAALYGSEAQAFVPNAGQLAGYETFLAGWQGGIDAGVRRVTVEPAELVQSGALGYESGVYAILSEQGAATEQGYYVIVWRQENGQWKWHRHIWNQQARAEAS